MTSQVKIHPLLSPWGRFSLRTFYLDAPEPAIVDTGISTSPLEGMAPQLARLGRRIEDVRWILLTHGHIDHVGGAHALWELTGRRAQVVIHEADVPLLRSRRAHVQEYLDGRAKYLGDPGGEEQVTRDTRFAISGELEPDLVLRGGEQLSLGGGVTLTVHPLPGHTAGGVAFVVDGQNDVFVGDSVQVHGAANGFPGFEDPDGYRAGLITLRDDIRPRRLYLGHPYQTADGVPYGEELDTDAARAAIVESLDIEARIREAAFAHFETGLTGDESVYTPFGPVAEAVGYTADPTLNPMPFFTTLHAYRELFERSR